MSYPFVLEIVTKATTAAAIGEQVIPTCEAMEATPQGGNRPQSDANPLRLLKTSEEVEQIIWEIFHHTLFFN